VDLPEVELAGTAQPRGGGQREAAVQLPKVSLPRFGGNPLLFKSYWQMVDALVLRRVDLPPILKLIYVIGTLEGEALRSVSGYTVVEENLPLVVEVLTTKYGDETKYTQALLSELMELKPASDSVSALRALVEPSIARS